MFIGLLLASVAEGMFLLEARIEQLVVFLFYRSVSTLRKELARKREEVGEIDAKEEFARWARLKREIRRGDERLKLEGCTWTRKMLFFIYVGIPLGLFFVQRETTVRLDSLFPPSSAFCARTGVCGVNGLVWYLWCQKEIKRILF
ncbi:MAG: uncharacterized protein A8A55_1050 [Amphiamblys sp. WSBS2006]|nr:MAG: uncharacterized protein A8A55_1050 [Amphiamblys sp. WSBS2006]